MGINEQQKRVIEYRIFNALDTRAIEVAAGNWHIVDAIDRFIESAHKRLAKG